MNKRTLLQGDGWIVALQGIITAVGGFLVALLGGWDVLLQILLLAMGLDVLVGMYRAYDEKKLSSTAMRKGLAKKVGILVLVALAFGFDQLAGQHTGIQIPLARSAVIIYEILGEALSIIEHLALMDVDIPKWLKEALWKAREQAEGQPAPNPDAKRD